MNLPGYDEWKAREPQPYEDGPGEPTEDELQADYLDKMQQQGISVAPDFFGDWVATRIEFDAGMPHGSGETPQKAVADLLDRENREDPAR